MQQALEKIPVQLISLDKDWLNWHYEKREGKEKPFKVPNVPANWYEKPLLSFGDAIMHTRLDPNKGIGIAFRGTNNIVGIDLDNISDKDIPPRIKAILTAAKPGGYIERSVSRTGFHIIGECSFKPLLLQMLQNYNKGSGAKSKDKRIELYAKDRFFTVSGFTLYNSWTNIDLAVALAWEYITKTTLIDGMAAVFGEPVQTQAEPECNGKETPNQSVCGIDTTQTSVAAIKEDIPRPNIAFSDEEISQLRRRPIKDVLNFMYKNKPILKRILESDGYAAAEEYWKLYGTGNNQKDKSPSGFDQEIASVLTFWLYRYGVETIANILKSSVLDRKKVDDYWIRTVQGAYDRAIEYFPAAYKQPADKQIRLNAWMTWKKELAAKQKPA